jgi:hypothetical protein
LQSKLHLRLPSNSLRHVARVPLGTTIQKKFGREGTFVGMLVSFDEVQDLYQIRYDGDDVEELSWVDFAKLLRVSGDTVTAPGVVPPLCVEAPSKMSHATTLQLQRNLLTKESHRPRSATQLPRTEVAVREDLQILESSTASAAGTARKRQKLSKSSTSGSDTMICSVTKISAHNKHRTKNTFQLEEPQATSAPIRKSPRVHVPQNVLADIAAQFAVYGSSDAESDINGSPASRKQARADSIGSSDSSTDSDTEFIVSTETRSLTRLPVLISTTGMWPTAKYLRENIPRTKR